MQYQWLLDNLTPKYGRGIASKIAWWFELCEDEYDNMDNIRVAEKGNSEEMNTFEEMREQGCCGSHEWAVVFGKREFLVGFNYGH